MEVNAYSQTYRINNTCFMKAQKQLTEKEEDIVGIYKILLA